MSEIHIPHWFREDDEHPGFQHYRDREPIWIKNYTRLLSDEAYLRLTLQQRGVLHGLWLEYARSGRQLPDDTASISRRLAARVPRATLQALNHAGFILIPASSTLATRYQPASPEKRREEKRQDIRVEAAIEGPLADNVRSIFQPIVRKRDGTMPYTGCRVTKGTNGVGYVRDILGVDRPPADWKHEFPSAAEVARELERRRAA